MIAGFAARAEAVPPPLSEAELEQECEVTVQVRVLGVTCIEDQEGLDELGHSYRHGRYQAWVRVVKTMKARTIEVPEREGEPQTKRASTPVAGETIVVDWVDTRYFPKLFGAGDDPAYLPGEEVVTHLKWNAGTQCYRSIHWSARLEPTCQADVEALPQTAGEHAFAKSPAPAEIDAATALRRRFASGWMPVELERDGMTQKIDRYLGSDRFTFGGRQRRVELNLPGDDGKRVATYANGEYDLDAKAGMIDLRVVTVRQEQKLTLLGLYRFTDDGLEIILDTNGKGGMRPKSFTSKKGDGLVRFKLVR